MDDAILDSLLLGTLQYPFQANPCADEGTKQRKTATSRLGLRLKVRHYYR